MRRLIALAVTVAFAAPTGAENLYDTSRAQSLVADERANKVGDVLTVLLVETTTAESRADTSEEASYSLEGGVQDASGITSGGVNLGTESNGQGRTARSGRLRGQVSVQVERVLESGNLLVRGEQLLTINGEQQTISIEGVARPADIASDNSIVSTRLVNARIEYNGDGWVARSQKNGWFRRLMVFLGL